MVKEHDTKPEGKAYLKYSSAAVVGIACLVFVGWSFQIERLKSIIPGHPSMVPDTALGLVLIVSAFWLWHRAQTTDTPRWARTLSLGFAVLVTSIGALNIWQHLFSPEAEGMLYAVRMSSLTAVDFLMLGLALIFLRLRCFSLAQLLSFASFLSALLALIGHLFEVDALYRGANGMALHTSISFLLLSIGVLFVCSDQGWMRVISSSYAGGVVARRLLPLLILVPLLLGCIQLIVYRRDVLSPEVYTVLRSIVNVVTLGIPLWWVARDLNRLDFKQRQTEQALRDLNQQLEQRVAERTADLAAVNAQLRESFQVAQSVVEGITDPVYAKDRAGRYVLVNAAVAKILGFPEAEILGRDDQAVMPVASEAVMQMDRQIMESGEAQVFEELVVINYQEITFLTTKCPWRNDSGEIIGVIGLVKDITDRKQSELALQASEDRFRRAIIDAPVPILIHGENGEILQMSHAVSEITGYADNEISNIFDWTEKAYGDRQLDILSGIDRLYDLDRRVDEGEFEIRTKDGAIRTWLSSSAPLGRSANGTRLVISMAADITELKQAKDDLATRVRRQTAVTQLSQNALSGLDLMALFGQAAQLVAGGLDVSYCKILELLPNGQALRLCSGVGWQPDLVGQATVSAKRDSQAGYTLLSRRPVIVEDLRTETRFHGPPLLIEHRVVSGISTIIQGQDDCPFGILGAHSTQYRGFTQDDINFLQSVANLLATAIQRKQTERELHRLNLTLEQQVQQRTQALEDANRELEAFSYSVAHDLRAPLRAIQGFSQVLVEDYSQVLDELGKEYIHRMSTSAQHLDVLIQDLLTYSRLGRTAIQTQRVSLDALLQDILQERESTLRETQAEIKIEPELPVIWAQRSILKQILSNLIDNALKFVAPEVQPQVRIWAERQELPRLEGTVEEKAARPSVRIWIEDNGIGIATQHQQRIFKTFERLHGVEVYPGTGIGLAIVKRGVKRLGGKVGVESTLDQGSQFWIELPLS